MLPPTKQSDDRGINKQGLSTFPGEEQIALKYGARTADDA
jgi:hypothetical protein